MSKMSIQDLQFEPEMEDLNCKTSQLIDERSFKQPK